MIADVPNPRALRALGPDAVAELALKYADTFSATAGARLLRELARRTTATYPAGVITRIYPVDQDRFGHPAGNCFAACVATLLGVGTTDVVELSDAHEEWWGRLDRSSTDDEKARVSEEWWDFFGEFVARFGYVRFATTSAKAPPAGYAIAGGPTGRADHGHCVVVFDGRLAHDPHPSRTGILHAEEFVVLLPAARPDPGLDGVPDPADARVSP